MRTPIVAGNWKMNKTVAEARALVNETKGALLGLSSVDRVYCPPFIAIPAVAELVAGTELRVGAQDMHWQTSGAYTGEVSPAMVREFCDYVIIGHSERREHFGETDQSVNAKLRAALAHGLTPIVCVGETIQIREKGDTEDWVAEQVRAALAGLSNTQATATVLAYEPIWAIGTGLAATAEEAERVCGEVVRATLAEMFDRSTAEAMRIQYGGSVNAANAHELMRQPSIDGALVGGASLKPEEFIAIVAAAAETL